MADRNLLPLATGFAVIERWLPGFVIARALGCAAWLRGARAVFFATLADMMACQRAGKFEIRRERTLDR